MVLALELFNRPALGNRLDGFVIMAMTAWEQIVKAHLIEKDGESSIFQSNRSGCSRKTISMRQCLNRVFESSDLVKKNLERVQSLRDDAIHLLMPEMTSLLSRLFQATVFNYATFFYKLCGMPFLPVSSVGVLALTSEPQPPTLVHLSSRYGMDVGKEVLNLFRTVRDEIEEIDDSRYAIPIQLELSFNEVDAVGRISFEKAAAGGLEAIVVTKPIDHERTHPYLTKDAVQTINQRLAEQLTVEQLRKRLKRAHTDDLRFTTYDFWAVVHRENWRNTRPKKYYYRISRPETHRYSEEAVQFIIDKITHNADYLHRARRSYSYYRKQKRRR